MRVLRWAAILVVLAMLVAPMAASAATPSLEYGSAWQVQNLEDVAGHLTITFYGEDGLPIPGATISNDPIAANGSNNYFAVRNENLPAPFQGSAVIASDRELRVIHNLYAYDQSKVLYAASSAGYTQGTQALNLPLVMRNNNGYNTWFSVQNAGDEPTDVTVQFKKGSHGNNFTLDPVTILPGGAVLFDQSTQTELGSIFIGGALITSDSEPIVATLVELGTKDMMAYDGFGMEYEGVASVGAPDFVGPIFHYHNNGFYSGVQVQNVGDVPSVVTLQFTPQDGGPGVACTETMTINPGQSQTYGTYSFYGPSSCQPGNVPCNSTCWANNGMNTFIGSVTVASNSAGVPLNAIVNQVNPVNRKAASYSAFMTSEATRCVSAPLIMDRHRGYETALTIYNAGTTGTVDIDYTGTTNDVSNLSITGGKSKVVYNNYAIGNDYVGSAKICADDPNGKLLVIVNEIRHAEYGDSFYVYNGFNLGEPAAAGAR